MMKGQGDQSAYLGDLEYLDHLECLGDVMEGKMIKVIKVIKVINILMAGSLIIFLPWVSEQFSQCPSGAHLG